MIPVTNWFLHSSSFSISNVTSLQLDFFAAKIYKNPLTFHVLHGVNDEVHFEKI